MSGQDMPTTVNKTIGRWNMIRTRLFVLVLVISLLANCTAQLPVVTDTSTPSGANTVAPPIKPTKTVTLTPAITDLPTLTPVPTWTPLPTLSAQDAQAKIKELLETNDGCELPCWWGVTPNKTMWSDVSHFLSPIFQLGQGNTNVFRENGEKHTYTDYQFYFDVPGKSQPARIILEGRDDVVFWITIYPPATEYKYQLHEMLALLGPPKQIFISAQASSPIPELPPTMLVLDYSDMGVWASYGYIPTQVGENLEVCPKSSLGVVSIYDDYIGGRLELFAPNLEHLRALSIQDYADMVGGFTAKKLEDATNMTIESFYDAFIEPELETCLETPAYLWP